MTLRLDQPRPARGLPGRRKGANRRSSRATAVGAEPPRSTSPRGRSQAWQTAAPDPTGSRPSSWERRSGRSAMTAPASRTAFVRVPQVRRDGAMGRCRGRRVVNPCRTKVHPPTAMTAYAPANRNGRKPYEKNTRRKSVMALRCLQPTMRRMPPCIISQAWMGPAAEDGVGVLRARRPARPTSAVVASSAAPRPRPVEMARRTGDRTDASGRRVEHRSRRAETASAVGERQANGSPFVQIRGFGRTGPPMAQASPRSSHNRSGEAWQIGDAIGDVACAMPFSVSRVTESENRRAGRQADPPPADRHPRRGDGLGRGAPRVAGVAGEVAGVKFPQRLHGGIEGAAADGGKRRASPSRRMSMPGAARRPSRFKRASADRRRLNSFSGARFRPGRRRPRGPAPRRVHENGTRPQRGSVPANGPAARRELRAPQRRRGVAAMMPSARRRTEQSVMAGRSRVRPPRPRAGRPGPRAAGGTGSTTWDVLVVINRLAVEA